MTSDKTKRWLASTEGQLIIAFILSGLFVASREWFGWTTTVVIALAVMAVSLVLILARRRRARQR